MEKTEYLKKWSEKLSISIEEIEKEFNKLLTDEKSIHETLNDEQHQIRAMKRLALLYKKQLRSPAIGFEGIIIGVGDCVDIIARQKREALELFRTDPQTAVEEGVTNEEGMPLDTRKEWGEGRANPKYGSPLPEHNFLRNVWGIVAKIKSETPDERPKFFQMVISGEKAIDETTPLFKPIKFMAIDRSEQESNNYKLNSSTFTNFVVDTNLQLPKFRELIENYIGITKLKELNDYHNTEKNNYNRLVAIEADVSLLNLEPTAFGSRIMTVEDSDIALEDLDAKGVTCWLPPRMTIDFAEGSKVIVIGRTAQGKKKDKEGKPTEELGDITLNTYGLYVIPEYKIELPDVIYPITEESLNDEAPGELEGKSEEESEEESEENSEETSE